jgi:radical SAM protein (TIGR01212 family)
MITTSYPWGHSRRFNTFPEYMKARYGGRVQKLTIDAGFTCPNRDGSKGTGGCTFCNNDAFNPSYCMPEKSVSRQIREGIEFHKNRYRRAEKFIAYFQAYSNTYAPVEQLKQLYEEALTQPEVIGISIGTRPDCVNEEVLDYLAALNTKTNLTLEYGIESCYNRTLQAVNRGHSFEDSVKAIEMTRERGIHTGAHVILGLPGESREDMLAEASILSSLPLNNLKFHQLQIVKGTPMAADYLRHPERYHEFGLDEYLNLMADILERLNPGIIVERIAGETVPRYNLRPSWGLRYDQILVRFEKLLEERDSWQGKYWENPVSR